MKENKDIYVVGSINVDFTISTDRLPVQGETLTGTGFTYNMGGKGANQALASAVLGAKTHMIAAVGHDIFGSNAKEVFAKQNIDLAGIHSFEHESTGVAVITRYEKDNRIILHQGANRLLDEKLVRQSLNGKKEDILVAQYEVPFETVKYSLQLAKEKAMTTILNPAPAQYVDTSIYAYVDYLVLNQVECKVLTKIDPITLEDMTKAFRFFNQYGIKRVIITLGSKGSVYLDKNQTQYYQAHKVKVLDTTGAGDAYVGGLAYGLSQSFDIHQALTLAGAAGSMACQTVGAEKAMYKLKEIDKFLKEKTHE